MITETETAYNPQDQHQNNRIDSLQHHPDAPNTKYIMLMKFIFLSGLTIALLTAGLIPTTNSAANSSTKSQASEIKIECFTEMFAIEEGLFVTFPSSGYRYTISRENMAAKNVKYGEEIVIPWGHKVTISARFNGLELEPFPVGKRTKGFIASQFVPGTYDAEEDGGLTPEKFLIYQDSVTEAIKLGELKDLARLP